MDVTRDFFGYMNVGRTPEEFEQNLVGNNFNSNYSERIRARRGRNDGKKTGKRVVWKRDYQGRFIQMLQEKKGFEC